MHGRVLTTAEKLARKLIKKKDYHIPLHHTTHLEGREETAEITSAARKTADEDLRTIQGTVERGDTQTQLPQQTQQHRPSPDQHPHSTPTQPNPLMPDLPTTQPPPPNPTQITTTHLANDERRTRAQNAPQTQPQQQQTQQAPQPLPTSTPSTTTPPQQPTTVWARIIRMAQLIPNPFPISPPRPPLPTTPTQNPPPSHPPSTPPTLDTSLRARIRRAMGGGEHNTREHGRRMIENTQLGTRVNFSSDDEDETPPGHNRSRTGAY